MAESLPELLEIEPTLSCNLRCRMCHVSYMPEEPRAILDAGLVERLTALRGKYFVLGSAFEPTMHPRFTDIVRTLGRLDARLELITNGTRIDDDALGALADTNLQTVTISFDGIRRGTYEHIRRNANYAETIQRVLRFRERFSDRRTHFAANTTMMRRNADEVEEIASYWEQANFDLVRYLVMVVRENDPELIRESLYPVRREYFAGLDVLASSIISGCRSISIHSPHFATSEIRQRYPDNVLSDGMVVSDNPRARRVPFVRRTVQRGDRPGMWFPCKSPWTFARIMANGDVQLCYQFTVGNLHQSSFEDIWFGAEAETVRRRVENELRVCPACDYFRLCINGSTRSIDAVEDYLAGNLLSGGRIEEVDFERGIIPMIPTRPLPRLLGSLGGYNMVGFDERYLGIPQAAGPVDLQSTDIASIRGVLIAATMSELRRRLRERIDASAAESKSLSHTPQLMEVLGSYNLVRLGGQFIAVPHSVGPIDLSEVPPAHIPGALFSSNLDQLRREVLSDLGSTLLSISETASSGTVA